MTPAIRLTERERAEVRKEVFQEHIRNSDSVIDALNWSHAWQVALIQRDGPFLLSEIERILDRYLELNGKYADAEHEVMASKSINGKRYLEA